MLAKLAIAVMAIIRNFVKSFLVFLIPMTFGSKLVVFSLVVLQVFESWYIFSLILMSCRNLCLSN